MSDLSAFGSKADVENGGSGSAETASLQMPAKDATQGAL